MIYKIVALGKKCKGGREVMPPFVSSGGFMNENERQVALPIRGNKGVPPQAATCMKAIRWVVDCGGMVNFALFS